MNDLPVVSVVIPNYNYIDYFPQAMDSIAKQDYPNKQIIFIDDCSTDDSFNKFCNITHIEGSLDCPEGVEEAVYGKYKKINIIGIKLQKSHGPSYARNLGMKTLWDKTHAFAFLDADDIYYPAKISKSVDEWLKHPQEIGVVYSDYDVYHTQTDVLIREYKEPYCRQRLLQECIINNNSLVNKLALEKCGLYDEEMRTCEDYDLWMRITEYFLAIHIPQSLVQIRVTGRGATASVHVDEWNKNWSRVMQKTQNRNKK